MQSKNKDGGVQLSSRYQQYMFAKRHLGGECGRKVFPIEKTDKAVDGGCKQKDTKGEVAQTIRSRYGNGSGSHIAQINNPIHSNNRIYSDEGISPTLNTAQGGNRQPFVAMQWRRTEKGKQARKENQKGGCDYTPFSGGHRELIPKPGKLIRTITAQAVAKDSLIGVMFAASVLTPDRAEKRQNGRRFKEDGEPMFTLTGQDKHGVMFRDGRDNRSCLRAGRVTEIGYAGYSIRRLTPPECMRLQSFPDDWCDMGADGKRMSDSAKYKMAGNAVTVNVVREIIKKMFKDSF